MYVQKSAEYRELGTICGFRDPLGVLEYTYPGWVGVATVFLDLLVHLLGIIPRPHPTSQK